MVLKRFVDVSTVANLLEKGIVNRYGVRLLDCSYTVGPKPEWRQFEKEKYGNFKLLTTMDSPSKQLYLSGHIPEAVHMSLDAAMYPSQYQRFAQYPPELFQKYVQLLGIDKGEHLIFYGRNPLWGMVFPAKLAWLFKSYGHDNVSVINGGFEQWKKEGFEVATDDFKLKRKGNWVADDQFPEHNITFEELTKEDSNGKQMMEKTDQYNFLDTRIRGQFEGRQNTTLDPKVVPGSFIPGFNNLPSIEMLNEDNTLKSEEEISKWLTSNGYVAGKPTVTSCNLGLQASLLSYVMEGLIKEKGKPRLYNGSLKEIELRAPEKVSEGPSNPAA